MWIKAVTYAELKSEIAALKERVDLLRTTIEYMKLHTSQLEEAVAEERARANVAVDRMLGNQGIPPIPPIKSASIEELSSMFEEDAEEVQAIKESIKEHGAANVLLGIN